LGRPREVFPILIVDGNSLVDLSVIGTDEKWFAAPTTPESPSTIRIIMKDGVVYKNTLQAVGEGIRAPFPFCMVCFLTALWTGTKAVITN
jgi:hypothetical protein